MSSYARVALCPAESCDDPLPVTCALATLLGQRGEQVQVFHDRACFRADHVCQSVCGERPRYLDPWLMSPELCRESFSFAMSSADLALIVGTRAAGVPSATLAGENRCRMQTLSNWLDLPQISIVDIAQLDPCALPERPSGAAAVLLDRVPPNSYFRWQVALESHWGLPVVGGLPELPELRAELNAGEMCCDSLCAAYRCLASALRPTIHLSKLWNLADRPFTSSAPKVFRNGGKLRGLRVAIALDEAFSQYFPEVLDLLEMQGAEVNDFSPLRDQALPEDTDVVYLGGGQPERFLAELAANQCLAMALRDHVRQDRRVYAEGAGAALLCQQAALPDGSLAPMWGVIPALASFEETRSQEQGAEIVLASDHWLGPAGGVLRGYRNPHWRIDAAGMMQSLEISSQPALFAWRQVAISTAHINFAAQPGFLGRFATVGAAVS